jgi:predicted Zn-dependent protease
VIKLFSSRFLILVIALLTIVITLYWGASQGAFFLLNRVAANPITTPKVHPLPPSLTQNVRDLGNHETEETYADNYFAEIKPTPLGHLIWSQFPIKVYLEQASSDLSFAEQERFANWTRAVTQAVEEWAVYLPLELVVPDSEDIAEITNHTDIQIWRSLPPQRATRNPTTGEIEIPRAAAAQTRYQFYLQSSGNILAHRFVIYLSPDQSPAYTLATARHEFGHALGIWGHSPLETDVMYFSQVRNPPPISQRDINTLRKIYQQPTQLGWSVANSP